MSSTFIPSIAFVGFDYENRALQRSEGKTLDFGPFPGGITGGLQGYASYSSACIDASMTEFLQQVPFILLGIIQIMHTSFIF